MITPEIDQWCTASKNVDVVVIEEAVPQFKERQNMVVMPPGFKEERGHYTIRKGLPRGAGSSHGQDLKQVKEANGMVF
jgi:hypothetical protein